MKVGLLQLNAFVLISILLILKPVFTSMLLNEYGIKIMPISYILIAVAAVITHAVLNRYSFDLRLITKIKRNLLLHSSILFSVGIITILGVQIPLLSLATYIYISLFSLITISYFYQYCQSIMTIREAKRLYAFIGSGAIAGGVFGGYFTSVFAGVLGNGGLIISSVVFLLISYAIMTRIHNKYKTESDESLSVKEPRDRTSKLFNTLRHKHVFNIAMVMGLGVMVSKLVDYQFNDAVYSTITDPKELTSFFGFWFSTFNLVGLLLQTFFVTKLIDRVGVTKSLMVMPLFLLFGSALFLIFPILGFAILLKSIDGSLKQSIYKTSTEISIMPLSPALRNRSKTMVDVVIDSLATGLAGVFIYIMSNYFNLPVVSVVLFTIMIIFLWLHYAKYSKTTYTKELSKMVKGEDHPLNEIERIGSTAKALYIDEHLSTIKGRAQKREVLIQWLSDNDSYKRKSALLKFVKMFRAEAPDILRKFVDDPVHRVRKAAYFGLVQLANTPEDVQALYAESDREKYIIITSALAEVIGNRISQKRMYKIYDKIDYALDLLLDVSQPTLHPFFYAQLYKSIAITKYSDKYSFIKKAIQNPIESKHQEYALKSIAYGKVSILFKALQLETILSENKEVYFKVLANFPRRIIFRLAKNYTENIQLFLSELEACKYIDSQENIAFLLSRLDHEDEEVRRNILQVLNHCRKVFPHLDFNHRSNKRRVMRETKWLRQNASMLVTLQSIEPEDTEMKHVFNEGVDALNKMIDKRVYSIFIYLALITRKDEIGVIYNALESERKEIALDFLDNFLNYSLKKRIVPIIDMVVHDTYSKSNLLHIDQKSYNLEQTFYLMHKFNLGTYADKIKDYIKTSEVYI